MAEDSRGTRMGCLFTGVIVIFGLAALILFVKMLKADGVKRWPSVAGLVTRAEKQGWWDEKVGRRFYLTYQYEVNDKTYTSSALHLEEASLKRLSALRPKVKAGDSVQVWYNPEKPEQAVLNTELPRDPFGLMLVVGGFVFMAVTMVVKERRWDRVVEQVSQALPKEYRGERPLPESDIVQDSGAVLRLQTGLSVFWRIGMPFAITSFVGMFVMMVTQEEINPGWTMAAYLGFNASFWALGLIVGFLFSAGCSTTLEVNAKTQTVTETATRFFRKQILTYRFSDISQVSLSRDGWSETNTQKGWKLALQAQNQHVEAKGLQRLIPQEALRYTPLFVSVRGRDTQPADQAYLEVIRKRLEFLIFGKGTSGA